MNISIILTIITSLGLGSLVGIIIQSRLDKAKQLSTRLNELNEEKYKSILIYMSLVLSPNNLSHFIMNDDILPRLKKEELSAYSLEKLREYYYHSILYANDKVLRSIKDFIDLPTRDLFINAALAMRQHLWGNKTEIKILEDIN